MGYFREAAEKLIEDRGAVEALAAALAHISGAGSLEQRSLLNSDAVSLFVCVCVKETGKGKRLVPMLMICVHE